MPSKRQPSKQRRASQSRARREALAARTQHAAESPAPRSSDDKGTSGAGASRPPGMLSMLLGGGRSGDARSSTRAGGGGSRAGGGGRAAAPSRPAESYWGGLPGLWQVAAALGLGVVAFVVVLFANLATVDDRGDLIPRPFGGVHLAIRSLDAGHEVESTSTTILDAGGPAYLALYAAPLVVLAVAFLMYKNTRRSRVLTISLLAMAVLFFTSGYLFLLSLLALGWATVVARRYDVAPRFAGQDDAIDVDAVDEEYVEDDEDEDEYEDDEYEDDEYDEEDLAEDDELEDEEYEDDDELVDEDEEYDEDDDLVDEDEEQELHGALAGSDEDDEDEAVDVVEEDDEPAEAEKPARRRRKR